MALLLTCGRRINALTRSVRRHTWSIEQRRLHRLRGQTLGIVGFGAIAHSLVPKAAAFGLNLIAYTPRLEATSLPPGVSKADSLEELLAVSDFVTLHAPVTPETRGLIGESELRLMKSSAYLINTSRGALVDEAALARAVAAGWIAGAALDVLSVEPPPPDHPLLDLEGVILTPHSAFYSEQAVTDLETRAATNVAMVLSGRLPEAIVNRDVLERPELRVRAARRPGRR